MNNKVFEATIGTDIATTDANLNINEIYQQTRIDSLARQVCAISPISGPTGGLFVIKRNPGGDFFLTRNEVEVIQTTPIKTGITQETIQNIQSMYGMEANNIIGRLLRGSANMDENAKFLNFLDLKSFLLSPLTVSSTANVETIAFEILGKITPEVLLMNTDGFISFESWVILPYKFAAAFAALNQYIGSNELDENELFAAKIGLTKFFINPNALSNKVYFGLYSEDPSKASVVFSPYTDDVIIAQDYDTGNTVYNIFNRYAITENPLTFGSQSLVKSFVIF
jgi:hypothetical protein